MDEMTNTLLNEIRNVRESIIRLEGKIDLINNSYEGLEKRVQELEATIKWLWKTVGGQLITILIGAIAILLNFKK